MNVAASRCTTCRSCSRDDFTGAVLACDGSRFLCVSPLCRFYITRKRVETMDSKLVKTHEETKRKGNTRNKATLKYKKERKKEKIQSPPPFAPFSSSFLLFLLRLSLRHLPFSPFPDRASECTTEAPSPRSPPEAPRRHQRQRTSGVSRAVNNPVGGWLLS